MEPNFLLCDVCGDHLEVARRFDLGDGYVEPHSMKAVPQPVDLCHTCCTKLVQKIIAADSREMPKRIRIYVADLRCNEGTESLPTPKSLRELLA